LKGEDLLGNLLNNQNFEGEIGIYLALFQVSILESHLSNTLILAPFAFALPPGKDYLSFVMSESLYLLGITKIFAYK
jgi:hypothetical protein